LFQYLTILKTSVESKIGMEGLSGLMNG